MKHAPWLVLASLLVPSVAAARPDHRCGTMQLLPALAARPRPTPARTAPLAAGAPKQQRDAYGPPAHVRTSANFAVKWGPTGSFTGEDAAFLLDALETSWREEMEDFAFTPPVGTESYLFNVYIYGTGHPIPDLGPSTYAFIDDEGYPYVMIDPVIIDPADPVQAGWTTITAAHELFHTVQFAIGAYDYTTNWPAYWYWEATADWMATQVFPEEPVGKLFMPYYLFAPHLGIESVVYPMETSWEPRMLHHYGAQALPLYLTEQVADPALVYDSWMDAAPQDSPLANVDQLLRPHGIDLDRAFADFAARAAVVDFPNREDYLAAADELVAVEPAYDARIAAAVPATGTTELVAAPPATRPEAWAYNVLRMTAPGPGRLTIALAGDATGSAGTPATFRARLVRQHPDRLEYVTLATDGRAGEQAIDVTDDLAIDLVVTSQPAATVPNETFDYRYRFTYATPEPEPEPEPGGCGCRSNDPAGTLPFALGLLVLVRRRRTGRGSSPSSTP